MSRSTHDINLDHHGTLDLARVGQGLAPISAAFGRYYATDTIQSVLESMDERLTAIANGYNIMAGSLAADAVVHATSSSGLTADAVIE